MKLTDKRFWIVWPVSHLGDCELYGRRLERGHSVARCGLCVVAIIGMAVS